MAQNTHKSKNPDVVEIGAPKREEFVAYVPGRPGIMLHHGIADNDHSKKAYANKELLRAAAKHEVEYGGYRIESAPATPETGTGE